MSLIDHYRTKLSEAIAAEDALSDQIGETLKSGKSLDDEEVVSMTKEQAAIHKDVETYTTALQDEQTRGTAQDEAMRALETAAPQGSRWVAPQVPETQQQETGPAPYDRFGHFLESVCLAGRNPDQVDPRLREIQNYQTGLGERIPSEGGFLVQTDFEDGLLRRIHDTGKLLGLPREIPISGRANSVKINAIDETSRVAGSRLGGVRSYWGAEAATFTASAPTFRQIELSLNKLHCLYYATEEELADTVALEETVAGFVAEEFGFQLDDALIRGTGGGQPLGILGHAGTVSVAEVANQGVDTITAENVEAMYARAWARGLANAVWLINQDCWPQLFQMGHAVGLGGVPVFLPSNSLEGAPFGTLLGRPILPIEQCATVGDVGDIILADFSSGYIMAAKGGVVSAVSIHVEFLTDQSVFRFSLRKDGQPIANAALTPYQGTNTQSSFITLDTRT